jgi:RNA polymerase sigma-70 factor, ECF subfamily
MSPADKARLGAMVDQHVDMVWRTLRRLGVSSVDMDDCMQEVFLVASRKLSSIEMGSEQAFLLGTALRVVSDVRRNRDRRPEVLVGQDMLGTDPAPQPDELADQKRLRDLLDGVLADMPMDLKTVFVLYELEEMSLAEIASLLEVPLGTVSSRLRRAREEFQRRLLARQTKASSSMRGGTKQ